MNKFLKSALFVAVAIAPQPTFAEPQQPAAQPASDRPVQMPTEQISMPFELVNNLVILDTSVGGLAQRAVLDSGSGAMIVNKDFAQKIGLEEGEVIGNAAGAGEQAQQLRPVDIAKLNVGPLGFENIRGYSLNLDQLELSNGIDIDLIIGAPAFKYGVVAVDYARNRVTFGPTGSAPVCAAPIPLTIVNEVPVVDVQIRPTPGAEPVALKLVVDLGTLHNAAIIGGPFLRTEAGKALFQSGAPQKVGHGTGGKLQGAIVQIAEFNVGALRNTDLKVALSSGVAAFESGFADGSLGVPFWQGGVITFDYQAGSLCIEK